jgi:hypothetical protein
MAIKPILFNTEMVRANLDGRKSCTRRIVKPQPQGRLCYTFAGGDCGTWGYPSKTAYENWGDEYKLPEDITDEELKRRWNPPYHTDDILYVRETWEHFECCCCEGDEHGNCYREPQQSVLNKSCGCYMYRATDEIYGDARWHPSIHMPKEAARIWLKVTDVRVERLQDMWASDVSKEGIRFNKPTAADEMLKAFAKLWDSTIKKTVLDRYGWDANPWVWVIEFERCEKPEGV